ncbi:MAG: Ig-like domain-containing protein, partial [Clostridiales Family XIII bacterium]|nr:Ig-like domain-containing protein [Clostridiales Family XIII bacterium]
TQPLTYRNIGDGAVSVDPASQSGDQVKVGTPLAFTATADTGNAFKEWMVKTGTDQYSYPAGGVDGDGKPILQMNMPDAVLEVVAVFENREDPSVSWSTIGNGTVALSGHLGENTAQAAAGTELRFAAIPAAGNVFKEWRVKTGTGQYENPEGTSSVVGDVVVSQLTMDMPDDTLEVIAVFENTIPTVTGVTVSPVAAAVGAGGQFQFSATVEGENLQAQDGVTWSVAGNISNDTVISPEGLLSVAPDEPAGTLTVRATSVYDDSVYGEAAATVTVLPPAGTAPTIVTGSLPNGQVGTAYSQTLAASGTAPISWTSDDALGALPDGLSLSAAGVVSGTPTASGTFAFTVVAANGTNPNAARQLSITVAPKTVSVGAQTGVLTTGTAGSASYTVTTSNIAAGAAIGLNTNGAEGVSLDAGTAATTGGSTTITIHTTDQTPAGAHPLTLTIDGVTSEPFDLVVGSVPDTVKPTVTDVTPSGDGAALSGFIVIFFSEEMDPQTAGTVSIAGGEGVLAGGEWANGGEYRILYTGFAQGTAYRVTISGFKDISGNAMDDDGDWQFTTRTESPRDILVIGIEITGPSSISTDGGTAQLVALVTPAAATNQTLLWAVSSGGEYATLSMSGFVTAKANGTVTVRAMALDGSGVYAEHAIAVSGQKEAVVTPQEGPTNITYNSYGSAVEQAKAVVGDAVSGGNAATAQPPASSASSESSAPSNEELFSIISTIQAKMEGQPLQAGVYDLSEEDAAKLTAWLNGEQTPGAAPVVKNTASGIPWWVILLAALILAAGGVATAMILESGRRNKARRERE